MKSGRAILVCMLTVGLEMVASSVSGAIVRLHSSVTVDQPLVGLGDVADVFGNNEQEVERLKAITLGTSPIPGNTTRLKLDEIRSRLARFNVEMGAVEFQGSSVVQVTRRGQLRASVSSVSREVPASSAVRPKVSRPFRKTELVVQASATARTVPDSSRVPTADIRLAEEVVHELVRDYLNEWAPDWGTPIIRPLLTVPTVPTILAARHGNLRIVAGKALADDLFLLAVSVPTGEVETAHLASSASGESESATRTVHVRVRVTRRPKVLTARRVIPQGQVVRDSDLQWKEVDSLRNGESDPEVIVGMEARRTIREGDFIQVSAVRPPTLIKRDELVKVAVQAGSIRVSRTLRARRSGILNDVIELVPLDRSDRTSIFARVTGKGQAEPINRESDDEGAGVRLTVGEQ